MYYDDEYTALDAARDAEHEKISEIVSELVDQLIEKLENLDPDEPHPWSHDRWMLDIYQTEGEGYLREYLVEELDYWDQAEDIYNQRMSEMPCCNSFYCPCGNRSMNRNW